MLYPRYLIAADMQTPYLFSDNDLYLNRESFGSPVFLARAIRDYSPDFILAPLTMEGFAGIIKHFSDYVLIFFDDTSALYVQRKTHPDLARTYELTEDPYHWHWRLPAVDKSLREQTMPAYLSRMLAIDPDSMNTRWRAVRFYAAKGDFREELIHGEVMIRNYPENYLGYLVKGSALRQLGLQEPALAALRQASARATAEGDYEVRRELAAIYVARNQPEKAFAVFKGADSHLPPEEWLAEPSTATAARHD
jgi:tetratricopeptide (TPR) repeat protein